MVLRSRPGRGQDWNDYGAELDAIARKVDRVVGELAPAAHSHSVGEINDATVYGRSLLTSPDASTARDRLGVSAGSTGGAGGSGVLVLDPGAPVPTNTAVGTVIFERTT